MSGPDKLHADARVPCWNRGAADPTGRLWTYCATIGQGSTDPPAVVFRYSPIARAITRSALEGLHRCAASGCLLRIQ